MFIMDALTRALFYVFLVGSMLGIGLKAGKTEILGVVRDKGWLLRIFAANFLLIPALGVLVARLLPIKPENALALILLACAPGGMSALQFLAKSKDKMALAYAGGTAVLLSFFSIILSPVLIAAALPKGLTLAIPYGKAILFLSVFMLLPLVLGVLIRGTAEAAARKLAGPLSWIATLSFFGVLFKMLALTKEAKAAVGKTGIVGIILFILVSMLIGWILGGPRRETRPVLATASSMRNVALGLAIAVRSFPESGAITPLVAFAAIMVPSNMLFMLATKAAGKMAAKRTRKTVADDIPERGARP
jgi:BASS family bile acid:Na+ symporter